MTTRIQKLQAALKEKEVDLLVIDNPIDLFYLTGLHLSTGKLLVAQDKECLFVDGRYLEAVRHFPSMLISDEALAKFASGLKNIAFDSLTTTYNTFLQLKTWAPHIAPWEGPTRMLRAIKDDKEKSALRRAAQLCTEGYDFALSQLREGISEKELALALEIYWKQRGGGPLSFDSIIAFGQSSSMPHYRAGDNRLKQGDIVLIDIGIALDDYQSDMTRTVFFGKPHPKLLEIHKIVKEAQEASLALCRHGARIGDVDHAARSLIAAHGYGEQFVHGLGHSIGLEVHEYPLLRSTAPYKDLILHTDMAVTIEPGIYLPGLGGVRIENTILIQENGYENLIQRDTSAIEK